MFVKNCWYVAGWDTDVDGQALFSRTICNEPILFYRDAAGQLVALEDRCCHRAAPLSAGRREGDCIRCMYHGLKFDTTGACIEIPGQDRIPAKARVRRYPVVQKNRLIWIWMGDPALADASHILDFFWHDSPQWAMKPGYIHYQANYQLIVDNLLDFTHLAWVHPTTLGSGSEAKLKPEIRRDDAGAGAGMISIDRWYLDDEMPPMHKKFAKFSGKVDRWQLYQWVPPGFLRMDAGSAPVGTGAPEGKRTDQALQFRHTSIQTPETESTSHYWFCQARNFELDDSQLTDAIFDSVVEAFEEDRAIIEAQQRNMHLVGDRMMIPIAADAALNQARALVNRLLDHERSSPSVAG